MERARTKSQSSIGVAIALFLVVAVLNRLFRNENGRIDKIYQEYLVRETKIWREREGWTFNYGGYEGPWLSESFYRFWSNTRDRYRASDRYYLPINFNMCHRHCGSEDLQLLEDFFLRKLDPSKKYYTVLLLDKGLFVMGITVPAHLDLVVFSAGDYTHAGNIATVPIPLLKEELSFDDSMTKQYKISFVGSIRTDPIRAKLFDIEGASIFPYSDSWKEIMMQSKFCLCPRG